MDQEKLRQVKVNRFFRRNDGIWVLYEINSKEYDEYFTWGQIQEMDFTESEFVTFLKSQGAGEIH